MGQKKLEMEDTRPKTFVFVLMPFTSEFDDVYELGIKAACRNAGAYCERVDEQIFEESILERIYNQIGKADVIVADMTGRNPNVFYETGYAHALNKRVILLTQRTEDIPFDLKHYPHIIYGGKIREMVDELERRVRWCLENPKGQLPDSLIKSLLFFVNGELLSEGGEVVSKAKGEPHWDIEINIKNSGTSVVPRGAFRLSLVLPNSLILRTNRGRYYTYLARGEFVEFRHGEKLTISFKGEFENIFPNDFSKCVFPLQSVNPSSMEIAELLLRVTTPLGSYDYPFSLMMSLSNYQLGLWDREP
uniref:nucleoside 2-deoxyribosyltransferase n=1 Tax=Desulfosarcina cetonica TaxID=90730 RepID=UPI000A872330